MSETRSHGMASGELMVVLGAPDAHLDATRRRLLPLAAVFESQKNPLRNEPDQRVDNFIDYRTRVRNPTSVELVKRIDKAELQPHCSA